MTTTVETQVLPPADTGPCARINWYIEHPEALLAALANGDAGIPIRVQVSYLGECTDPAV